ncbi:hypothetical protein IAT40_001771 [Kwoniella sp. CBS 6097]
MLQRASGVFGSLQVERPTLTGQVADADWWRQAVIYQIYPRSFKDNNGDGIGDLKGVTSQAGYLQALGVDAVWLSPFYPSALKDGGYDVADYRDVDPKIGTLEDFGEMVAALKNVGVKVMVDIVPNHCSDDHEWFQAAIKAGKGSPERERFIFRDGLGPNKDQPPTDWQCTFGGPAWSPSGTDDGQWYYHMFDSSQPDWNWNHPDVREDFLKTLRFWGDRGVAGFRIDVAHALVKDMSAPLPNWADLSKLTYHKLQNGNAGLIHPIMDRDEVHDVYKSWRRVFDEYNPPLMAVAEAWVAPDRQSRYASAEGLGQTFSFDILLCNFNAGEYRKTIEHGLKASEESQSSTTWVLSNHDVIRHATRFGFPDVANENLPIAVAEYNKLVRAGKEVDISTGLRRARAATLLILGLPGSTYIYQGEELGLREVLEIPDSERQDPIFVRTKGAEFGRDGCRVPLPWSAEGAKNFGFGDGQTAHLPQPEWFSAYAIDKEEQDLDSTLNLYRKALRSRRVLQGEEQLEWVPDAPEGVLHFKRPNGWEVVLNTTKGAIDLPAGEIVISSAPIAEGKLPAESTVWLRNN